MVFVTISTYASGKNSVKKLILIFEGLQVLKKSIITITSFKKKKKKKFLTALGKSNLKDQILIFSFFLNI